MIQIILVVLALVCAGLELFRVPSRVSWTACGVALLAIAMLLPLL